MQCPTCKSENLLIHSKRPPRWVCGDCSKTTRHPISGYQFPEQKISSNIVIITWAQNATPVFKPFLRSLLTYCEHRGAQLLVVPGRYKNPTSTWTMKQESAEWWASEVSEYLADTELDINQNLKLMGHIKVQPTAANPLTGLKTMGDASSVVIGHPQIALETVATPQSKMAKIVTTTGAITVPNYTDSTAGVKGDYHHEYGAAVVEIDGGKFHIRQLIADGSGKFYDLDKCYAGSKVTDGHRAEAFIPGDIHAKFIDQGVKSAWWTGERSLCRLIRPKVQAIHDLFDGYFDSHHDRKDPITRYKKMIGGHDDGRGEIEETIKVLNEIMPKDCKTYVVKSNHDEHPERWFKETDWRKNLINAALYFETGHAWITAINDGRDFDIIEYWIGTRAPRATFLSRKSRLSVKGYALDNHGDVGPNGSRGSAKALNQIGTKSVIGHSHSPRREKGCLQAGLSAILDLDYVRGPSGWMHTGVVIYPNGKATLISCIDGEYTI